MDISRNLVYEISDYAPIIIYIFRNLNKDYQSKVEDKNYYARFLKDLGWTCPFEEFSWREIFWQKNYENLSVHSYFKESTVLIQLANRLEYKAIRASKQMNELTYRIDDINSKISRYEDAIDCQSQFAPQKQTEFGIYIGWTDYGEPGMSKIIQNETTYYLILDQENSLRGIIKKKEHIYTGEISIETRLSDGIGELIYPNGTKIRGTFSNGEVCGIAARIEKDMILSGEFSPLDNNWVGIRTNKQHIEVGEFSDDQNKFCLQKSFSSRCTIHPEQNMQHSEIMPFPLGSPVKTKIEYYCSACERLTTQKLNDNLRSICKKVNNSTDPVSFLHIYNLGIRDVDTITIQKTDKYICRSQYWSADLEPKFKCRRCSSECSKSTDTIQSGGSSGAAVSKHTIQMYEKIYKQLGNKNIGLCVTKWKESQVQEMKYIPEHGQPKTVYVNIL